MLKLIKYDFRRSRDQILGVYAVMLLIQAGIWITAEASNWNKGNMFILHVITYIVTANVFVIFACRTYDFNLKSYGRQLLPVKTVRTVLSPLLLNCLLLLGLIVVAALHLTVAVLVNTASLPRNFWPVASISLLYLFGAAVFLMLMLMLSITLAQSVRIRGKVWIGIVTFFVLNYIIGMTENWLFKNSGTWIDNAFQFSVEEGPSISQEGFKVSRELFNIGPSVFEICVSIAILYVITLLVKKRVEL